MLELKYVRENLHDVAAGLEGQVAAHAVDDDPGALLVVHHHPLPATRNIGLPKLPMHRLARSRCLRDSEQMSR